MKLFYITQGLPASGKSSWAKVTMETFRENGILVTRVNRDLLREMLHCNVWSKENERVTVAVRNLLLNQFMTAAVPVIICDDTNLDPRVLDELFDLAEKNGYDVKVQDFTQVPVWTCIERDIMREGYARVGPEVILNMHNKYLKESNEPV